MLPTGLTSQAITARLLGGNIYLLPPLQLLFHLNRIEVEEHQRTEEEQRNMMKKNWRFVECIEHCEKMCIRVLIYM